MALTKFYSVLFLLGLNASLLAQTNLFKLSDIDNYFVLNDAIYDVRNFSKVTNAPISSTMPLHYLPKSQVFVSYDLSYGWLGNKLEIFDKTGKKTSSNHYSESKPIISSSRTGLLFVKENDLWYGTINILNGTVNSQKRLTNLGIISGLPPIHWYGPNILVYLDKSHYVIDIDNGQMTHVPFIDKAIATPSYPKGYISSPNGRYLVFPWNDKEAAFYFDMLNLKKYSFDPKLMPKPFEYSGIGGYYATWISEDQMIFWSGNSAGSDPNKEQILYKYNLLQNRANALRQIIEIRDYVVDEYVKSNHAHISNTISPDTTYMLIPMQVDTDDGARNFVDLYNLKTLEIIKAGLPIETDRVMMISDQKLIFSWISPTKLLFKQAGGITNQGTWLYDVDKNTNTKLTPFIADEIQVLPKAGYTIFVANNHVFRVKNDGTGLTQLTKEQLYQARISEFYFTSNQ